VVSVVDVRKMKVVSKHSHKYQVNELAFAAGGRLLLQATGSGGEVEALRWPEMRRAGALRGHTAPVLSLGVDPKERYIASGGADAVTCLWDAEDMICLRTFVTMDHPIRALAFSHDSRYLAMTGEDPRVFVEDVQGGHSMGSVALRGSPEDCAWHPKHHTLAYPVEGATECTVELRSRRE
jgi:THO complex subunit 3